MEREKVRKRIKKLIAGIKNVSEREVQARLKLRGGPPDLNFTKLGLVDLVGKLNEEFRDVGLDLRFDAIDSDVETVGDLITLVCESIS